jgi:hypothetical protein
MSGQLLAEIMRALHLLPQAEQVVLSWRFGLQNGSPLTIKEIAAKSKFAPWRVAAIEANGLRLLAAQPRIAALVHNLGGEPRHLPAALRAALVEWDDDGPALVWCPRHGWTDPRYEGAPRCQQCPCAVGGEGIGRRRRFCSGACQKQAARRRAAERARAEDDPSASGTPAEHGCAATGATTPP